MIAVGKFEPAGFAAPLGEKDIRLTLATAEELRVPPPLGNLVHDRFLTLLAHGGERLDWAAIGQLAAKEPDFPERSRLPAVAPSLRMVTIRTPEGSGA